MAKNNALGFSNVGSYLELRDNLCNKAKMLHNKNNGTPAYLCHYTSLDAIIGIIKSHSWYIGSPKNMNDGLELSYANEITWNKLFFSSFMIEPKESK